jgi:hypothetical protein
MRKSIIVLVAVLSLGFSSLAFAGSKTMMHGKHSSGTVVSVNETDKSFVLRDGKKDTTVYWTGATKVTGGSLKANEHVNVRWMEKDGKVWATAVNVGSAKTAATAKK